MIKKSHTKFVPGDEVIICYKNKTSYGTVRAVEPRLVEPWMAHKLEKFKYLAVGQCYSDLVTLEERADIRPGFGKISKYDAEFLSYYKEEEIKVLIGQLESDETEIPWMD